MATEVVVWNGSSYVVPATFKYWNGSAYATVTSLQSNTNDAGAYEQVWPVLATPTFDNSSKATFQEFIFGSTTASATWNHTVKSSGCLIMSAAASFTSIAESVSIGFNCTLGGNQPPGNSGAKAVGRDDANSTSLVGLAIWNNVTPGTYSLSVTVTGKVYSLATTAVSYANGAALYSRTGPYHNTATGGNSVAMSFPGSMANPTGMGSAEPVYVAAADMRDGVSTCTISFSTGNSRVLSQCVGSQQASLGMADAVGPSATITAKGNTSSPACGMIGAMVMPIGATPPLGTSVSP